MDFFPNLRLSPSSPFTDYKMKIQKYVFPYLPHSVTESYCLVSPNWFFTDFFSNKVVLLLMFIKTGFNWEQVMLRLQKISLSISWEITNLLLRFRAVPGGIYVVFCQMQQVFHQSNYTYLTYFQDELNQLIYIKHLEQYTAYNKYSACDHYYFHDHRPDNIYYIL